MSNVSSVALKEHFDKVSQMLTEICAQAAFFIDQMHEGERTTVTKLANDVANSLAEPLPGEKVLPVIRVFIEKCPGIVVLRGSTGGLFKGFRPTKSE